MKRVVVTGHDASGASVVVSDEVVAGFEQAEGLVVVPLWRSDTPLSMQDAGPPAFGMLPSSGGSAAVMFTLESGANDTYHEFIRDNLGPHADVERPGMHVTPTRDYVVIVAGEVMMELDRDSVRLGPGDLVVQNGTMHRWSNIGSSLAVLMLVLLSSSPEC